MSSIQLLSMGSCGQIMLGSAQCARRMRNTLTCAQTLYYLQKITILGFFNVNVKVIFVQWITSYQWDRRAAYLVAESFPGAPTTAPDLGLLHIQSWTGPWDTPTPWDRAHFSLPQQHMFQFFELSTSIIVLSIFTESLIKLQAKVLELFEKECILGLKTIS